MLLIQWLYLTHH